MLCVFVCFLCALPSIRRDFGKLAHQVLCGPHKYSVLCTVYIFIYIFVQYFPKSVNDGNIYTHYLCILVYLCIQKYKFCLFVRLFLFLLILRNNKIRFIYACIGISNIPPLGVSPVPCLLLGELRCYCPELED